MLIFLALPAVFRRGEASYTAYLKTGARLVKGRVMGVSSLTDEGMK
jgi:hypothetical protein